MAEKGFGVKEINLIGASGTPTIESPNNLNLNAVNVAISTNVSIGGTLSVTGNVSVGGTFGGHLSDAVTSRWTLGANGTSHYTFTGPGGLSNTDDPKIYLARGQNYEFVNNSGGSHPFQIRNSAGGSAYNTGVTNNGASSGNIVFTVPMSAPATLYYQCTAHSNMGNTINIV